MHAMRRASESLLRAVFGARDEQKEESAWSPRGDADTSEGGRVPGTV